MISNGWKQLYNISFGIPFGWNYSAMPSHTKASNTYSCYRWLRDFTFPRIFPGWNPLFFVKKKACSFLSYVSIIQGPLLHSPLTIYVLSNTALESLGREKVKIYTSRGEKLKRKKELISHKIAKAWSSYYDLFTESKKNTFWTWKATQMFKYIFVMTVMVFVFMFCAMWI